MKKNTILVINCGSSSLKFSLLEPKSGESYLNGIAECLNTKDAKIKFILPFKKQNEERTVKQNENQTQSLGEPYGHQTAINTLVAFLEAKNLSKTII